MPTLRTKIFVALALFLLVMTGVLALIRERAARADRQERVRAAEAQAAIIAAHREAQRREAAAPVPEASDAGVPGPTAPPETAAATAPRPAVNPYWTDFRGPARDGHYRERAVLTEWPSSGIRPLWKQPIGGGHASFVIAAGRAFTIEQRGPNEVVAAYDVMTGRELWTHGWPAMFSEHFGGEGPRATPVWHEGALFALGAAGELRAIDAAGESS